MQTLDDAAIEAGWATCGPRWNTPLMKETRQAERDRYRLFQPQIERAICEAERDAIFVIWEATSIAENDAIAQRHGLPGQKYEE